MGLHAAGIQPDRSLFQRVCMQPSCNHIQLPFPQGLHATPMLRLEHQMEYAITKVADTDYKKLFTHFFIVIVRHLQFKYLLSCYNLYPSPWFICSLHASPFQSDAICSKNTVQLHLCLTPIPTLYGWRLEHNFYCVDPKFSHISYQWFFLPDFPPQQYPYHMGRQSKSWLYYWV